jgi:hypothetical protein
LFNGVQIIQDKLHRCAKHAVDAIAATLPAALVNSAMPYMPKVKVLSRRDAVVLYLPNIAGAADYRAYVVGSGVTFAGSQPRSAVIACAGFRQRHYDLELGNATPWHELLQALELPGLTAAGNYTIIVEAIKSPCPFTGMPAATDADITVNDKTNLYAGNSKASFRSFDTVRAQYGNEIINGQGSATSWTDRMNKNILRGLPVSPASTTIPKDPVVIARSAIKLSLPATDETVNAPIFDVGANSTFDDFSENLVVAPASITNNNELAGPGNQWFAPLATIPGRWTFWGNNIQHADGDVGKTTGMRGAQIFQRYGRLYQTSGDAVQCCMSSIMFSSLKTLPQQLDSTKYVHSFFRVNSDATTRRYWVWLMCGAATREELVNTTTHMPLFHPAMDPGDFDAMGATPGSFTGKNPSMQHGSEPASATRYNKECLQFIQHGVSEPHWPNPATRERSGSRLMLVLHPKGVPQGSISYAPTGSDWYQPSFPGWTYRIDSNKNYAGPMMEPFDQYAPLTHFDLFVRSDRVVVFINGRQALCANMTARPLTMKYGLITYGNALYHTAAETEEAEVTKSADYHYRLNEPIADTRVWDAVGHSQLIDIPTNIFTTFDASQCTTPASTAVL